MVQVHPSLFEPNSTASDLEINDAQAMKLALSALTNTVERLSRRLSTLEAYCEVQDVLPETRPSADSPNRPQTASVDARDFLEEGDGFHQLEFNENGDGFRWTGPAATSHVRLSIDRTFPIQIGLWIVSLGIDDNLSKLRLEIDGSMYSCRFSESAGMARAISEPIRSASHAGPTDVLLHVDRLFCPRDAGQADDRHLGIAIHKVTAATIGGG